MATQRDAAIAIARSQLGYHEGPGPTGHGNINKFSEWLGNFDAAWCNAFVSWCAYQVGVRFPGSDYGDRGFAYVPSCANYFKRQKRFSQTPRPGEWGVIVGEPHITLVEYVSTDGIHTIEGNEADQVMRKTRPRSDFEGFCQVAYAEDTTPTGDEPLNDADRKWILETLVKVSNDQGYAGAAAQAKKEILDKLAELEAKVDAQKAH